MSRYTFEIGKRYTRRQIRQVIGLDPDVKGGNWYTGYAEQNGADFIFCNVGIPGRTGHDYNNHFENNDLLWHGKTNSHKNQPVIQRMTGEAAEVHVFWREDERDPFTYAGLASAVEVTNDTPVKVRWRFSGKSKTAGNSTLIQERLPVEALKKVTAEHVWNAVQMFLEGHTDHQFLPSTDYDLLTDGGGKTCPKGGFRSCGYIGSWF